MRSYNDITYYRRRESAALALAARSSDGQITRIHRERAESYAAEVRRLSKKPGSSPTE